jgi:hypothetical protein
LEAPKPAVKLPDEAPWLALLVLLLLVLPVPLVPSVLPAVVPEVLPTVLVVPLDEPPPEAELVLGVPPGAPIELAVWELVPLLEEPLLDFVPVSEAPTLDVSVVEWPAVNDPFDDSPAVKEFCPPTDELFP